MSAGTKNLEPMKRNGFAMCYIRRCRFAIVGGSQDMFGRVSPTLLTGAIKAASHPSRDGQCLTPAWGVCLKAKEGQW